MTDRDAGCWEPRQPLARHRDLRRGRGHVLVRRCPRPSLPSSASAMSSCCVRVRLRACWRVCRCERAGAGARAVLVLPRADSRHANKACPLVCIHAQYLVLRYCGRGVGTPPCSPCTATSSSPTAPRRSPTTLCPPHGPVVAPTPQCFQPVMPARGDEIRNGRALQCVALAQASPRGGDMWAHPYLQQINEVKARPAQPRHRVSLVLHS